jgi:hypothetical protein
MHRRVETLRSARDHERFAELCALSTSGALTASEWKQLAAHLKDCRGCRLELSNYQDLAASGMALLAPKDASLDIENEWSPESAVAQCMSRLQKQPQVADAAEGHSRSPLLRTGFRFSLPRLTPALPFAAAAIFLVALSLSLYVIGVRSGERRVNRQPQSAVSYGSSLDALLREHAELQRQLQSRAREISGIQDQLASAKAEVESLRSLQATAEETLARLQEQSRTAAAENTALQSQKRALEEQRDSVSAKLTESEANLSAAQRSFDALRDQRAADLAQIAQLQERISAVASHVQPASYIAAQPRELAGDPELRELMGARDLFIADVYDIDKTGQPQKPFGRVFYTKGKSLLFYAFDLDRQPGVKMAGAFQVWGRRGYGDTRPLNMGMMYLDNAVSKRWVLKYNDAKALAQVDAVYVTIEPRGGSDVPKGRQLLYASLRTPSNHP